MIAPGAQSLSQTPLTTTPYTTIRRLRHAMESDADTSDEDDKYSEQQLALGYTSQLFIDTRNKYIHIISLSSSMLATVMKVWHKIRYLGYPSQGPVSKTDANRFNIDCAC